MWAMLTASALWFLIGLVVAGVLWHFFKGRSVARLMAGNNRGGVIRAALIGLPLPLCSCSVLPVASQLRSSGAGRGGTAAFLVSTPETGVDSIALTYTLTDPILTVARPVTAFVTALAAGGVETLFPDRIPETSAAADLCVDDCPDSTVAENRSRSRGILSSLRYAFTDLLGDLSPHLFLGFALAGFVGAMFGHQLTELPEILRHGWGGYAGAIAAGLPLYICASSSTPLAAVLLAGGFSPGMVLVFMMTGAATNISTIAVTRKILGGMATVRYLASIVIVSVLFGILTDRAYDLLGINPSYDFGDTTDAAAWYDRASALVLGVLICYWTLREVSKRVRSFFLKNR